MKRIAQSSSFLWAVACILLVSSTCFADLGPRPSNRPERQPEKGKVESEDVTVDFVMKTKFAKDESYVLVIPQSVIDEAAGKASTSSITKIKTIFAGLAISLAVLSVLVLLRKRDTSKSFSKAAVAATMIAILLFGALPFAVGDVAPREPDPVEDQVTVKIVKDGDAVELIRYVPKPIRDRPRDPREDRDRPERATDGASPESE